MVKRIAAFLLICAMGISLLPANLLAATVRAKDGTAIMTARSPEQVPKISRVSPDIQSEVAIDPADGSLEGEKGSMEDVIPISKSRRKKLTKGSRKKNRKAIREYLEDQKLYCVREEEESLKVSFPFSSQRLTVVSPTLTETCGAETALYYAPKKEYLLTYDSQEATREAYENYKKEYGSDQVFLDLPVHADAQSWGINMMNLSNVTETANMSSGKNKTVVAVLDSGVNTSHSMFSGRTILSKSKSFCSPSISDDNGHGSHVAGILAEGTSDEVEFLILKILNRDGEGSAYDLLLALEYALNNGADVANLSLGVNLAYSYTRGKYDPELGLIENTTSYYNYLNSFLAYVRSSGMVICAAAGNENVNINTACTFPAKSENVICAGSVNQSSAGLLKTGKIGMRYTSSNYGPALDFVAPGVNIKSASFLSNTSYVSMTGTSMAAPHIAAAAAMVKVYHPSYDFGQVYAALKDATGASAKVNDDIGYGMPVLDVSGIEKDLIVRDTGSLGKVTGVSTASLSYNTVRLSWNGVSGATGYVIYQKKGTLFQPVRTSFGNSIIFTGLTCGNKYYYKVAAFRTSANKRSYGAKSNLVSAKPIPGKTVLVRKKRGIKKIRLRWKKVAGASGYQISRASRIKGKYKKLKTTKKLTFTNKVKRRKKYYYRIRAYRKVFGVRIYGKYLYFTVKSR